VVPLRGEGGRYVWRMFRTGEESWSAVVDGRWKAKTAQHIATGEG
jgi:hypothetical protein